MTIPDKAVQAAEAEFTAYFVKNYPGPDTVIYKPEWHAPKIFRAALHSIRSALPFLQGVKPEALQLIERMAFGYEVMFEKLCHISGTSGESQSWYMSKAREATNRISPLHSITIDSNKVMPGDCKKQYRDFMARILSAIEVSAPDMGKPITDKTVKRRIADALEYVWSALDCDVEHIESIIAHMHGNGLKIVDTVNPAPSPRAQALEESAILEALEECETYFEDRSDADHDEAGFVPNEEMRILVLVRAAIRALSSQPVADGCNSREAMRNEVVLMIERLYSDYTWHHQLIENVMALPASPGASE